MKNRKHAQRGMEEKAIAGSQVYSKKAACPSQKIIISFIKSSHTFILKGI